MKGRNITSLSADESNECQLVDSTKMSNWKKYYRYEVDVDENQNDKAKEIMLCTFDRPHMRAFHCAWWGFFIAFFMWFALTPLMPTIQHDLKLTKTQVWDSTIAGVAGTIIIRLVVGPLCDLYGARIFFSILLCAAAIPTALVGLVHTSSGLCIMRALIGIVGGTFVCTEYWASTMFTKEVVGTANGLVAGWGNLGAGVTQLIIGSILFPLIKLATNDENVAWRTVVIIPAAIGFITGVVIFFVSDDSPKGNVDELKAHNAFAKNGTLTSSFYQAAINPNSWLLFIQYMASFGVELTMSNAAALYFRDHFGQSVEAAAAIASIFGWLNLFARGLGGFLSDCAYYKWGMRGRLAIQGISLFGEGCMVLIFSHTRNLAGSIVALVFFSLFVQIADGTAFGIVPYIDPLHIGSVTGIVGAGGNVGSCLFSLAFRQYNYKKAFLIMGLSVIGISFTTVLVSIKGFATLFSGEDLNVNPETGDVVPKKRGDSLSLEGEILIRRV